MRGGRGASTGRSRAARLVLGPLVVLACAGVAERDDLVVLASGADLESANPLTTIHPLARQVQRYALFVTLARYDSLLAPEPYFAKGWTWSDDRRSLTLDLHTGLAWHDGAPTTSRDVVYTLTVAREAGTGYYRRADLAAISALRGPNDSTVTLVFDAPQSRFPAVLCELPMVPEHLLSRTAPRDLRSAPFAFAPVGNGPFRFVGRQAGRRWIFARNERFPAALGGPPRLDRFVVVVVDEPTTKFAGLVSGDLHVAGISPTMAALTAADRDLRVLSYPVAFSTGLVFNTTRPPFDEARVRRAIDLSIRRDRIVQIALAGHAAPARGPIPPDHPFAPRGDSARRPNADSLLDAAGWRRGADGLRRRGSEVLRLVLLSVGSGDNAAEQLVQADLRKLGLEVELRQMELGAFLSDARATDKRFDALIAGVPGDLALSHLEGMFATEQRGGALDYAGYHRPGLDSLLRVARLAPDEQLAARAWHAVADYLAREAPVAWLFHSRGVQGVHRSVQGVEMDLRGELVSLAHWTRRPERAAARTTALARP
jgi:peptide/nickel transport system substrate-binding protein